MKIPPKIKPWIKITSLIIGVIADGIMLFACFTSQAPDLLGKIAFGTIGIMIILLIPITYEEKAFKLWLCLVIVAVFFDTSYLLATTKPIDADKIITVDNDKEIAAIDIKIATANASLSKAQDNYSKALSDPTITRPTMENLNQQIIDSRADVKSRESDRKSRVIFIESGLAARQLTADDIFKAIPDSIGSRPFQFSMYLLIAVILQGFIVFSLSEENKKKSLFTQLMDKILGRKEPVKITAERKPAKPKRKRIRKPAPKLEVNFVTNEPEQFEDEPIVEPVPLEPFPAYQYKP